MALDRLDFESRLDAGRLPGGHRLSHLLEGALSSRAEPLVASRSQGGLLWAESHFGLDKISLYQKAGEAERRAIWRACCDGVLEEAYWIEKCGMYYASKMSLLAENTEERMLYGLFAADETLHFRWISQFVEESRILDYRASPFLRLLNAILERSDKVTLTYVIQIVLEGWGLSHYQRLWAGCREPALSTALKQILKDEARHHASGLVSFEDQKVSGAELSGITEALDGFFRMVQAGPQGVAAVFERVLGPLRESARTQLFDELGAEAQSEDRIRILVRLIRAASHCDAILPELERRHLLRPFTASQCAKA